MKVASKFGLLLCAALMISAVMAVSAQAVTISPNATAVTATATTDPQLTAGGTTITCLDGTAAGTTGTNSASIVTLSLTFQNSCTIAGFISATVTCVGTVTLTATTATGGGSGKGTADLNSNFECTITGGGCTIIVTGPEDTTNVNSFNAGTDTLNANVTVTADVTQTCFGGPTGTGLAASFVADYTVKPTNLAIN